MDEKNNKRDLFLSLAALGVVFGDIGTSPLYAIREGFHGDYGIAPYKENIFGVLSLLFWSLTLIVSIKYIVFILKADNKGEGGILALLSLIPNKTQKKSKGRFLLISTALFGACLLYGDGMITPAISVLSAVEGLKVATPALNHLVVPITIFILFVLFLFQKRGTATIGSIFGPIMMLWFLVLLVLGIRGILLNPRILCAINPMYAIHFFQKNGTPSFLVLGAVFLAVTGSEALYADMGHFGKKPIRRVWFGFVLPSLLINYFGQGALILKDANLVHNPFYNLSPSWMLYPLILLATLATIIASQAVITGAFSLTFQAIQMGFCPRLKVIHTSSIEKGQIYLPYINWVLMITTIFLVMGFQSSSKLAAAYGVAVTTTMLITSLLFYVVARECFRWSFWQTFPLCLLFLGMDLSFFGANIVKIGHGAWFPLVIGAMVFIIFQTWKKGRKILAQRFQEKSISFENFFERLKQNPPLKVPGMAVFMTSNLGSVPPALIHNLTHNKVLHETIVFLTVQSAQIPRVPREEKVAIKPLGNGFYQLLAQFGFIENINVPYIFALAREKGLEIELKKTSFFLGRERFFSKKRKPAMPVWQEHLFTFLSHNAQGATAYFNIPPEQVLELGAQVQL